ncbi:MAG: endo-1,4-beta-xylanase, partial [Planctomycetota bacterium]
QRVGLKIPSTFHPIADQALDALLKGVTTQDDSETQMSLAQQAIDCTLQASVILSEAFSLQALEARRNNEGRLATLLGGRLAPETNLAKQGDAICTAFNMTMITSDFAYVASSAGGKDFSKFDTQVDWATNKAQKLCMGPIVDFRKGRLPSWLTLLDDSFESILNASCQHVQNVVERYKGKIHLWNCATGINVPNGMGWNDEEILRLAVSIIETVRRSDERSPVLLTIDQPWSEYLRSEANGISPIHFADALIRADLGLNGLALELNFDQWPGGSFPRDPIEISRLIDRWAMLGLPLMVILTMPTQRCEADTSRVSNWSVPDASTKNIGSDDSIGGMLSPELILRLLLCKPSIHAIVWNNLDDSSPNSATGLWDTGGRPKPLLSSIAKMRKTCLH